MRNGYYIIELDIPTELKYPEVWNYIRKRTVELLQSFNLSKKELEQVFVASGNYDNCRFVERIDNGSAGAQFIRNLVNE